MDKLKQISMYTLHSIQDLQKQAEKSVTDPIVRYGVQVFVDSCPEYCAEDIYIDSKDEAGIAIFREFAQKMADHYKSLINR